MVNAASAAARDHDHRRRPRPGADRHLLGHHGRGDLHRRRAVPGDGHRHRSRHHPGRSHADHDRQRPAARLPGDSGDTPTSIAAAIAAPVNATATVDPVTGLPLNQLVSAAASGATVTLTAASRTTWFTLAAGVSASGYTAGRLNPPFAATPAGAYLTDPAQTLFGHQPTLCAACSLTGADFALITQALGYAAATGLTLDTVSAVFRYAWLAHTLSLSVPQFIQLRHYSGLDPFAPLDPGTAAPVPPPAVRFVQLVQRSPQPG